MVNDTIGDLLTRIRNAGLRRSETVSLPLTRIGQQICQILEKEGLSNPFKPSRPKNCGFA
jgi:small subunit ribosomal protein S8